MRNTFGSVEGKYGDISKQLTNIAFYGVICVVMFSYHIPTRIVLFMLIVYVSRVVPLLNIGLVNILIAINQNEKLYQCICIMLCIIVYTNFTNLSKIVNTELENVNIWLKANKLTVNIKKTHYMMFHRIRIKLNTHFKILINNNKIDYTHNTKLLGVIIDNKLNWYAHLHYIKNENSNYIGNLFKILNF